MIKKLSVALIAFMTGCILGDLAVENSTTTTEEVAVPHHICPSARCSPVAGCSIGVVGANTPPAGSSQLSNGVYWVACTVRSQAAADSVCSNAVGCGGGSECVSFNVNDVVQFMTNAWDITVSANPGISSFDLVNAIAGRTESWTLSCLDEGVVQVSPDFPASSLDEIGD